MIHLYCPHEIKQESLLKMINDLGFDYLKYQKIIEELDAGVGRIEFHNKIYQWDISSNKAKHHFHQHMGPCPFEGNLLTAKVILLLANPGFNKYQDPFPTKEDHKPRDGWGIANLSPEGESNWYRPRFRTLLDHENEEEWQSLSNKMAMVQVIPWASEKFKDLKLLPSRDLMSKTVKAVGEKNREALFVIMRRRKFWEEALKGVDQKRIIVNPHPICSYITKGNFGDDWDKIKKKLDE